MTFSKRLFVFSVILFGLNSCSYWTGYFRPLKVYHYSLPKDELELKIKDFVKANPNFSYVLKDITGNREGSAYNSDIKFKDTLTEYKFHVVFEDEENTWKNSTGSKLELIGAFDYKNHLGGYRRRDNGVKNIIKIFSNSFILQIDKKTAYNSY